MFCNRRCPLSSYNILDGATGNTKVAIINRQVYYQKYKECENIQDSGFLLVEGISEKLKRSEQIKDTFFTDLVYHQKYIPINIICILKIMFKFSIQTCRSEIFFSCSGLCATNSTNFKIIM